MTNNDSITELFKFLAVRNQPRSRKQPNIVVTGDLHAKRSQFRGELDGLEGDAEGQRRLAGEYIDLQQDRHRKVRAVLRPLFKALWRADEVSPGDVRKARDVAVRESSGMLESGTDEERIVEIGHLLEGMILAWSRSKGGHEVKGAKEWVSLPQMNMATPLIRMDRAIAG